MFSMRNAIVSAVIVLCLAGSLPAQATSAPAVEAKVFRYIPADAAAFVVVNNIKDVATRIDALVKNFAPPGGEGMSVPPMLDTIRNEGGLGEIDVEGSFGVVVLDPKTFNVKLADIFSGNRTAADRAVSSPTVMVVPGADPEKIFTKFTCTKDGDLIKMVKNEEIWFAKPVEGFVVISENKKALAMVAENAKSSYSTLPAGVRDLLAHDNVVGYVNMKVLGPSLDAAIAEFLLKKVDESGGAEKAASNPMEPMLVACRELFAQMDGLAGGLRFEDTGIFVDARVAYLPDSLLGKAIAAVKVDSPELLDRLPNMSYVLAMGCLSEPKMPKELQEKQISRMLAVAPWKDLKDDSKKKFRDTMIAFNEQSKGVQFYVGGVTTGMGTLGVAMVAQAESAAKLQGLLADMVDIVNELIAANKETLPQDLKDVKVKYVKGAEPLGDNKLADAINIEGLIEKLSGKELQNTKAVLGDEKLNIMIAPADEKTLVLTFGGGKTFLQECVKTAADKSGKTSADPMTMKSLALLPKNRAGVMLFNLTNLVKLVKDITTATGEKMPPIAVGPTPPVAGAYTLEGHDMGFVLYVPTQTIVEVYRSFMMMMMAGMSDAMQGGGAAAPMAPMVPAP